ncbi:Glutathione hydrolase proenzyme [Penicillium chermesinum]|nr:Glutathione hydrolase proenzyme [Penicillium chermesinum]
MGLLAVVSLVLLISYLPRGRTSPIELGSNEDPGPGKRGAVATENSICSQHGIDILTMGGNAADALVASQLCVGVTGMYHSGIGGGGFMVVRSPDGEYEFIDFRETAPAAAYQDMFKNNTNAAVYGGLASGVPGEIRGLEYLHKKYGILPWSTVVMPAVRTAREGFPVSEDLVRYSEAAVSSRGEDFLANDPNWALDFAPNGTRLGLGDIITRKRYADTLETIAKQGPDAFYSGAIADTMINAIQKANGTMVVEDLTNYTVAIRNTSQITYRGQTVTSTTTPSSGSVALSILSILNTYDDFFTSEQTLNLSTHRFDEAIRFAYGQETQALYQISDQHTLNVSAYDPSGLESLETPGTSHLAVADHTGLAVSSITTVNLLFGSQVLVPETGIIMNNEMDVLILHLNFSIPGVSNSFGFIPSEANFIRPGKRPMSSITPVIVTRPDGQLALVAGSAGGSRIITATVASIIHVIDQGLDAAEALAKPRLHDQLVPDQTTFEYAYDNSTVAFMKSRGHNVTWVAPGQSSAQLIRVSPNGTFDAAGEPRQLTSAGYSI